MPIAADSLIQVSIKAETLFTIGPLQVTNSMVGAVLASAILLGASWWFLRGASLVPSRFQSAVELPIEWLSGIVAGSTSRWRSYVGLVVGLFLMILIANWLGVLPGVGTIGLVKETEAGKELVPFVRPAAADLNFTLGLALITFVVFVWWAVRLHGPIGYLKELAGEPRYMAPLMFPIHLISELSRLISLSMRLFGNVFAGEVLMATMLALTTAAIFVLPLAFFVPAFFILLELLFGLVQAMVFALLTMAYITLAIAEQQGGHAESDQGDHAPSGAAQDASAPAHS
ncbi:MAG: F0F1 ATP synthase subunit A [Chloroflexi bacterium]|nr:MAG: F0F1 ATP synthase subunit A [Chloroflexota bacterium]